MISKWTRRDGRPWGSLSIITLMVVFTAVAVACSSGYSSPSSSAYQPTPAPTSSPNSSNTQSTTKLMAVMNSELGSILTDENGKTLYLYEKDSANQSICSGGCASAWPPLAAEGTPQAGDGVSVALIGTITRSDGSKQVTYNNHPLYYYVKDQRPGDITGEDVGGVWYAVTPQGESAEERQTSVSPIPSSALTTTPAVISTPTLTPTPNPTSTVAAMPTVTPVPTPTSTAVPSPTSTPYNYYSY